MLLLIIFSSTHHALAAEQALESERVDFELIPAPPTLKADCGLAIEFDESQRAKVEALLSREAVQYVGIYTRDLNDSQT